MRTHTNLLRRGALLLALLLLAGCLAACSAGPANQVPQPPARDTAPVVTVTPTEGAAQPAPAEEATAEAESSAAQPETAAMPPSFRELCGRWTEPEGRAELWIQYVEGEDPVFSLFIPGSAAINNTRARQDQGGAFEYEDRYLLGVGASGSLTQEDGIPVLRLRNCSLKLEPESELRFTMRSPAPDYATLYAPVLDAWMEHELAGGGLENWYGDEPGYVHCGLTGADHFGYQYWDLDRDGSPELILGVIYSPEETAKDEPGAGLYSHNLILDLFTLDGDSPRYVVNSGDRYRYSLTTDGLIYYEGSGGAAYSEQATYQLYKGELRMAAGLCVDGGDDACFTVEGGFNPEHSGYTNIPSDEFFWLWDNNRELYLYERFAPLVLRPLLVSEA